MTTSNTDYQAVNRVGTVVHTFAERPKGVAWVKANLHLHDGLVLEVVETVVHRRVTFRPRTPAPAPADRQAVPA